MKKATAIAMFMAIGAGTASVGATITLAGSDSMGVLTRKLLTLCDPAKVAGITYAGGGSTVGGTAMTNGLQQVAPQSRLPNTAEGCTKPATAESMQVACDALAVLTSSTEATRCATTTGGLAKSTNITLDDGSSYTFNGWQDVLRTLFAGRDQAHFGGTTAADCNSTVRKSLVNGWTKLFQSSCATGDCSQIKHLWRRDDNSGTTDTFIGLLGLPGITRDADSNPVTTPFCNGRDWEDNDPIRVACAPTDDVCGVDSTLGLLQAVASPEDQTVADTYPSKACTKSFYRFVPAADRTKSKCPGAGAANFFNLCLMPAARPTSSTFDHACLKARQANLDDNDPPAFTNLEQTDPLNRRKCTGVGVIPNTYVCTSDSDCTAVGGTCDPAGSNKIITDVRVYNRYNRVQNGTLLLNNEGKEIDNAIYRIHQSAATPCQELTATNQIGCLVQQYACSLGYAATTAEQKGSVGANINGILPTAATCLNKTYPFSRGLFLGTEIGFENVSNTGLQTDGTTGTTNELNFAQCYADSAKANAAALFANVYPLNSIDSTIGLKCVDFNGTVCPTSDSTNACVGNPAPFPKSCGPVDCVLPQTCHERNAANTADQVGGKPTCL